MFEFTMPTILAEDPIRGLFFTNKPSMEHAQATDGLFMFIFWVSAFFFVLIIGLMLYFMVRYKRRPGVAIQRSPHHNTPLELAWSIIPLLILVVIFFWGFHGYLDAAVAPADAQQLRLTAQKWKWTLEYPNGETSTETMDLGSSQVPIFYVPAGKAFLLKMESTDVIHSFWIPDYRAKFDVFPNRYTSYWFRSDPLGDDAAIDPKEGFRYEDHWIMCAEYCGDQHSEMLGVLRVVDEDYYTKTWYPKLADDPTKTLAERGEKVVKGKGGCLQCHTTDGTASTGPTWQNLYGYERRSASGQTILVDDNFIRESILNPNVQIREGFAPQMNSYAGVLSADEIYRIIWYIRSLSDEGHMEEMPPPEVQ